VRDRSMQQCHHFSVSTGSLIDLCLVVPAKDPLTASPHPEIRRAGNGRGVLDRHMSDSRAVLTVGCYGMGSGAQSAGSRMGPSVLAAVDIARSGQAEYGRSAVAALRPGLGRYERPTMRAVGQNELLAAIRVLWTSLRLGVQRRLHGGDAGTGRRRRAGRRVHRASRSPPRLRRRGRESERSWTQTRRPRLRFAVGEQTDHDQRGVHVNDAWGPLGLRRRPMQSKPARRRRRRDPMATTPTR
jgi:hypothetical protein